MMIKLTATLELKDQPPLVLTYHYLVAFDGSDYKLFIFEYTPEGDIPDIVYQCMIHNKADAATIVGRKLQLALADLAVGHSHIVEG